MSIRRKKWWCHYSDIIMSTMASQITAISIVSSDVFSGADQRKHQCSLSLVFVMGIQHKQVDSPHNGPVMQKMFPFYDITMAMGLHYHVHTWVLSHLPWNNYYLILSYLIVITRGVLTSEVPGVCSSNADSIWQIRSATERRFSPW